ncbi:hypothetical protein GYA27_00715 [candidate division WWE3 bacterium]|uniref:Uncharacterized protein n=1 Tax=candidate division WWE3 bacterium TaxID=2053526 RepID=A0A7X9HGV6_UNCKA|nr:hypothetical protein [candidate division WWE3 bacterium]
MTNAVVPIVRVEVRLFDTTAHRDAYGLGQVDGDELMANPKDYGVKKIVVAESRIQLRHFVAGQPAEKCALVKLLTTNQQGEHEAGHTSSLDTAIGWFLNP